MKTMPNPGHVSHGKPIATGSNSIHVFELIEKSVWFEFGMMMVTQHICYLGLMWMIVVPRSPVFLFYPLVSLWLLMSASDLWKWRIPSIAITLSCLIFWIGFVPNFPAREELPQLVYLTINPLFYGIYLSVFTLYKFIKHVRN